MSHDLEASYAAAELASNLQANPGRCFRTPPAVANLSAYAAREGRHEWPHADGVIELALTGSGSTTYPVAVEFKRPNEGVHGILTAIGQAHAYIRKGYSGSVIVIPNAYPGLADAGKYVKDVLDSTSEAEAIGVFAYDRPDMSKPSPYAGKLQLHRTFVVDGARKVASAVAPSRTETQWAHVREGSTDPDAFFRYLQAVKLLGGNEVQIQATEIPKTLLRAVEEAESGADPVRYLSNCPGEELSDKAWRYFWFRNILHPAAITGWNGSKKEGYEVNATESLIRKFDGTGRKRFFVGRSDSVKNKIVAELEAGKIGDDEAAIILVNNYRNRAHSYREDIDSGCEHLGLVEADGRLTDDGFRFVSACERYGNPNEGLPRALFLKAVLGEGGLGAFLHYVYRLSEECFRKDPLAFSKLTPKPSLDSSAYLGWLEGRMVHNLKVMRKVSARGGVSRKPFQAELAILRNLKIAGGFRVGVGLEINWPEFQEALMYTSALPS